MAEESASQLQLWIDRLRTGDPDARRELVGHACGRLRELTHAMLKGYRRLHAWEDTDDVLHTAVLRLLRALEATTPATVDGFLALAAQHIRWSLLDLSRHYFGPEGSGAHRAQVPEASDSLPAFDPPQSTYEPGRLADWTEFHRRVEMLPDEERAVFDLVWYQGLSTAEAARALDLSHATVKRRWVAARLRLQEALDLEQLSC